jgi:hypothetical protein
MTKNLMRFDISGVTSPIRAFFEVTILDYNNCLGINEGVSAYLKVARILRTDWVEAEATWTRYKSGNNWTTAGADSGTDRSTLGVAFVGPFPNQGGIQTPTGATAERRQFDVTAMLLDALANSETTLTIALWGTNFSGHNEMTIATYSHATTRYRPRLVWG